MKIPKITLLFIAFLFLGLFENVVVAQTPDYQSIETLTAHIPYTFWMEGVQMPAGDYSISSDPVSVMVFWNQKAGVGEQAFLIPTGHSVSPGDYKLIFVVRNGEHYLRAVWFEAGSEVLSSQFQATPEPSDSESQVQLVEHPATPELQE